MNNKPIAYMDSGVGGLTVAKVGLQDLPKENLLYLGDEARMPYGRKTPEQVRDYSCQIGNFFVDKGAKLMIIACNTATAAALPTLKKELPIPVIGVIEPGSRAAAAATQNNRIGVIGTPITVNSHSYKKTIQRINSQADVFEVACPDFVTLVESGKYATDEAQRIVERGLEPFKESHIDTLVLGCTHFPIIANLIQKVIGQEVKLINPGFETVNAAKILLANQNQLGNNPEKQQSFYTTADVSRFDQVGKKWLKEPVKAKLITTNELEKF